jgi:hypothetical protein
VNFHHSCPHCGATLTAYTVPFNKGLAVAFLKFADARVRAGAPIPKRKMGLTNSEYGNFPILRHFKLVRQAEKGKEWEMTPYGWKVLSGELGVVTPVAHMGGRTLESDHPAWQTFDGERDVVYLRDVLPDEWKQRSEFALEKAGVA